jgi:ATP-binding cassette subfamily C (CFTR/MRP) protein 1
MVALLRMVELDSGCILIDEKDIKSIGLSLLRRKIATIPQDPTLFSGTIRTNLDPFHEFTDDRLSEVLIRVGLFGNSRSTVAEENQAIYPLDSEVLEGGSNFSVGQRQLIVIARALLRKANIVILDEATASEIFHYCYSLSILRRRPFTSSVLIGIFFIFFASTVILLRCRL